MMFAVGYVLEVFGGLIVGMSVGFAAGQFWSRNQALIATLIGVALIIAGASIVMAVALDAL